MKGKDNTILLNPQMRKPDFDPCEILYCRAYGSYTEILLKDGKARTVCKNLKSVAKNLPIRMFHRCHHSYLINIEKITGFDIIGKKLIIEGRFAIPVSRRRFSGITCKLKKYM